MTLWRPLQAIRVKVIGLAWSSGRMLAAEVMTDDGRIKGVRPLGGAIDFGETREQALHREFREELGTEIRITGAWQVFENIYEHEGATGHEIVFAAEIELADAAQYARERIVFLEDDGTPCCAAWFDLEELATRGLELYPNGLAGRIAHSCRAEAP